MDYKTGIVGIKRQISRKGLCEVLEVHKRRGSHRVVEPVTKDRLRALFNLLLHRGLIVRVHGYENTLVFRLPLADFDDKPSGAHDSVSMRSAPPQHPERTHMTTPMSAPMRSPVEANNYAGFDGLSAPNSTPMIAPPQHPSNCSRSAPHPVSVIRNTCAASTVSNPRARVDGRSYDDFCAALSGLRYPDGGGVFDVMQVRGSSKGRVVIERWVEQGVDPEVIVKVAADKVASGVRIGSVQFLDGPVADYLAARERPVAVGNGERWSGGGFRKACGGADEVIKPPVVGCAEYAKGQAEFERKREEDERELMAWGKKNGMPLDLSRPEPVGDYLLRVRRRRREMEGRA